MAIHILSKLKMYESIIKESIKHLVFLTLISKTTIMVWETFAQPFNNCYRYQLFH